MDCVEKAYQEFIHLSRYSKYVEKDQRREIPEETVPRYFDHIKKKVQQHCKDKGKSFAKVLPDIEIAQQAVINQEVMPSMRGFMVAGSALDEHEVGIYNCAYEPIDCIDVFAEATYLLMVGCGFGTSVEHQYITQLPPMPSNLRQASRKIEIKDTKEGWADAVYALLYYSLYEGILIDFDYSAIRPKGTRLKTMGGRASGPEPLRKALNMIRDIITQAVGRPLSSVDCCDILCIMAQAIIVGGTRRSSCICLTDLDDLAMRDYKKDTTKTFRYNVNVSAVYESPEMPLSDIMSEWSSLIKSKTGDRGIFNRHAANMKADAVGREHRIWGTNPCGETILQPCSFCNLTEVIIRPSTSYEDMVERCKIATNLGIWQSLFTDFKYLKPKWTENAENSKVIGVSLTGIADNKKMYTTSNKKQLAKMRTACHEQSKYMADKVSTTAPTAVTTIKPSGTVSKKCGTAPGIHPRINSSRHFKGNVRQSLTDPITKLLIDQGVPYETLLADPENSVVFTFPLKSPKESVLMSEVSVKDQLDITKHYRKHWCDHNVSTTIHLLGADEWADALKHLQETWDEMVGTTFLERDTMSYTQPPYEAISKEEWDKLKKRFPKHIDWTKLQEYESEDNTKGSQQRECAGGACHLEIS